MLEMPRPEALTVHNASHVSAASLAVELQALQAEPIGWLALGAACLHLAAMADTHVLWLV